MILDFHEPQSPEDAVRLKQQLGEPAVFLAGGTEVNSKQFPFEPAHIISLAKLALDSITSLDGEWVIGAMCTIQALMDSSELPGSLQGACGNLVNRNVRNMATLGGHIASNKACADIIPTLVALGATLNLVTADGSSTTVALSDYLWRTSGTPLITAVRLAKHPSRQVAFDNTTRSSNDISIVTTAVSLQMQGDVLLDPIVAVGGVSKHVVRLAQVEGNLKDRSLPAREEIAAWVEAEVSPISDLRGSAELKRHLAGVLVSNAIHRASRQGRAS